MRRRNFIAAGAAGTAFLTGCVGQFGPRRSDNSGDETTGTGSPGSTYTVEMAPVGPVELGGPPNSVAHYFPGYADMAVALGRGATVNSIGVKSRYYTSYYDELDGVRVDKSSMTEFVGDNGIDKEVFYELNSDLHLIDPRWLTNNGFFGLEQTDVEELSSSVGPFLGNCIFRRTDAWHEYRYYSLYEAFEKVAQVHQETERFEHVRDLHDRLLDSVRGKLPGASDRPNALLCFAASDQPTTFSPYRLTDEGTNKKQFHDLGIGDALADTGIKGLSTDDRGQIDYETMLDVDPQSILLRGHETKSEQEFADTVLAFMRNHDTASQLTAVQNGTVFRGGPIYAGPIHNLLLTERFAKLYFPEQFSGELFDRDELASIVTG